MKSIRFGLAVLFWAVSLPLLAWGFWPPRRETVIVPLQFSDMGLVLSEARTIRLEFSPTIRAGDSEIVHLTLQPNDAASDAGGIYDEYTVIAEARLELPLADVRPSKVISTPLLPGVSATFYWEVRPRGDGTVRGTAWLYLRFVPKRGGEETRQPVSAQLVEIRSRSMLKRTGAQARLIGVIGWLAGLLVGIPFLKRTFRR